MLHTLIACNNARHHRFAFEVPDWFLGTPVPCPVPGCKTGFRGDSVSLAVPREYPLATSVTLDRVRRSDGDWELRWAASRDWDVDAIRRESIARIGIPIVRVSREELLKKYPAPPKRGKRRRAS